MNWDASMKPAKKEIFSLEGFDPGEQTVVKALIENKNQLMIDELSWRTNISVSQLASVLLGLEFKGVVASLPGKVYKLIKS
jgi:DNA processing protein